LYCDTPVNQPDSGKLKFDEIRRLIVELVGYGLEWIYICGLGEPSQDENFIPLINLAKENQLNLVFFTNGLGYSVKTRKLLYQSNVYPIVKCDSMNDQIFDQLLKKKGGGRKVKDLLGSLVEAKSELDFNSGTSLAISLIPTKINKDSFLDVVTYCINSSIFPVIGELEKVNSAATNVSLLELDHNEKRLLVRELEELLLGPYIRPICPGVFVSLHVGFDGDVLLGQNTGFSCVWFLQENPQTHAIGNIRNDPLTKIVGWIREYRLEYLTNARERALGVNTIFSAGGGTVPSTWINEYERSVLSMCYGMSVSN
jgi:MoaA/NifB/PqqE/SkfB family radical SAM enzyme